MLKSPAHGNGIEALLKLAKRATLNKHSSFKLITHHHWWHQGKRPGLPRKQSQHGHVIDLGKNLRADACLLQDQVKGGPDRAVLAGKDQRLAIKFFGKSEWR